MSSGLSFSSYQNWNIWVPVGVGVLATVWTVITVAMSLLWSKSGLPGWPHFTDFAYRFARLLLWDSLQKTSSFQLTLFDQSISSHSVVFLSSITYITFIPAFATFWSVFLFKETYACDPGLDCFLQDSKMFISHPQRLPNCTDHENDTVICLQFVLDYAGGFTAMGGFFAAAIICLQIYGNILVCLTGLIPPRHSRYYCCRAICSVIGTFIFFLTPFILAAIILIFIFLKPTVSELVFQSSENITKFATYFFTLLYIGPVTGGCILTAVVKNGSSTNGYKVDVSNRELQPILTPGHGALPSYTVPSINSTQTVPSINSTQTVPSINSTQKESKRTEVRKTQKPPKSKPKWIENSHKDDDIFPQPKLVGSVVSNSEDTTLLLQQNIETNSETLSYRTT